MNSHFFTAPFYVGVQVHRTLLAFRFFGSSPMRSAHQRSHILRFPPLRMTVRENTAILHF